jgi:RND family efflux transporter MFP subunit
MKSETSKPNQLPLFPFIIVLVAPMLNACQAESPHIVTKPKLVQTMALEALAAGITRKIPGRIEASQKSKLAFQVSGPLIELPAKEGDVVNEGDLLARIDSQDFQNRLSAHRADFEKERKQYERFKKLVKIDAVTGVEYEEKKADYEIAQARLLQAEKDLDETYLRAPFRGVVATRLVENFQNVKVGEPILLLEDISSLDIVINIPQQDLARANTAAFQHGAEVGVISFESAPEKQYRVRVKKFETRADPQTQTYKATLNMPAPKDINILPGMAATFSPLVGGKLMTDVFAIPVNAVLADETNKSYVWVVKKDSETVQRRNVTVGMLKGKNIYVLDGLTIGDVVVTAGGPYLAEGMKIRLANDEDSES